MDYIRIPHLGLLLTTVCNLNCHKCADLIPYRPHKIYSVVDVIADLEKILIIADEISEVLLIGGEVLLYKDLNQVIKYCQEQKKIKKIIITTNGTILPSDELWRILKHKKIVLRVSGYPTQVAPKRKRLIEEVRWRRIKCEDLYNMQWKNIGNNKKRNHSIEELKRVFKTCSMKECVTLNSDGMLFYCSRQMAAYDTDEYPAPLPGEFVNVRELSPSLLIHALCHFYSLNYLLTCDYCDGINVHSANVETARQILPKLQYIKIIKKFLELEKTTSVNKQLELLDTIVGVLLSNISTIPCQEGVGDFLEKIKNFEFQNDSLYLNHKEINIYDECFSLLVCLASDYRYGIYDEYENLIYGRICKNNDKNYLKIYVGKIGKMKFDLCVSYDELEILQKILLKSDWLFFE